MFLNYTQIVNKFLCIPNNKKYFPGHFPSLTKHTPKKKKYNSFSKKYFLKKISFSRKR